jgi:non-ribosomal peptide synthetase component F
MADTAEGLIGTLEYRTDLFNASTTSRVLRLFETLLRHVVEHPDEKLSALSNILRRVDQELQREELQASKKANFEKLKSIGRRATSASQVSLEGLR